MNTIDNVAILKALLPESSRSIYVLRDELKEKLAEKNIEVNYPTLRRRINKLVDEGFINVEEGVRKNGRVDQRGTKNLSLAFKGLVKLILEAELSESESRTIVNRVLGKPQYKKLEMAKKSSIQQISTDAIRKSFYELRPKVNLKYFDEDYVQQLVFDNLIMQNCLDKLLTWKKEKLDKLVKSSDRISKRELRSWKRKSKKDAEKISNEDLKLLDEVYYYLKEKQAIWNEKINLLKPIVQYFKKRGVKS